jgi:hypothetical protein
MRAVGFALTGSDNANPKVIGDRAGCVFAVKNELFRLNNVYTDRIKIQGRQRQSFGVLEQWVTVALQGDDIVFEETIEPPEDDGSELMRQMRVQSPSMFEPALGCLNSREFPSYGINSLPRIREFAGKQLISRTN